ncbi:MAG: hypothetical protein II194_05060 [Bacteroidales bacterium]|nr:hypothetical protein [Bacteroidales bacterium]
MRTITATLAAMLTALTLVAFESDAYAQARRGESRSNTGSSRTSSRTTSVTGTKPSGSKSSATVTRQSGASSRSTGTVRQSGTAERKPSSARPAANPSNDRRPSTTVTRPASGRPSGQAGSSVSARPSGQSKPSDNGYRNPDRDKPVSVTRPGTRPGRPSGNVSSGRPAVRPDAGHSNRPAQRPDKPVQIRPDRKPDHHKVHPKDRDFIVYDRPAHFWTVHNHCYGHRVKILPSHVRRHIYHGITYYCYNDIWYRPYGGHYVVCRPPFGTILAANLIADMTWAAVRMSYYYTVANTYSRISENNAYIAQQNALIAQNNATIAAQNQMIAMNGQLASEAYGLADRLGLVQSYAAAGSSYFYQDGVFYMMDSDGEYKVIVPPAGALVETLPEDYEMVTLNDDEYYKVDDTVYRVIISEGKPYFEVLGQLYV